MVLAETHLPPGSIKSRWLGEPLTRREAWSVTAFPALQFSTSVDTVAKVLSIASSRRVACFVAGHLS